MLAYLQQKYYMHLISTIYTSIAMAYIYVF